MRSLVREGRRKLVKEAVLPSETPRPPVVEECVKAGGRGSGGLGGAVEVVVAAVVVVAAGAEAVEAASGGTLDSGMVTTF
jgi:hypothetical protein